jgi:methionyl-tRNA formyltransferase
MRPWKIVFAGTPDFAVPSLRVLLAADIEVPFVLTQPDRPAGRGRKLSQSSVKTEALAHGLKVIQPSKLRQATFEESAAMIPDLMVVVAYGLLLPDWLLNWPRLGAINVHASLLPRWRGASPIQHAILAGDAQTGVSIMQINSGLDTGPVYGLDSLPIGAHENASGLHDRLANLGAKLLGELLPGIMSGMLSPVSQDGSQATSAPKINKVDALLNWNRTAEKLACQVRAFNPWPISETVTADEKRLRIWEVDVLARQSDAPPGSVLDSKKHVIEVATGQGVLRILKLQSPGGRVVSAKDYLNSNSLESTIFG